MTDINTIAFEYLYHGTPLETLLDQAGMTPADVADVLPMWEQQRRVLLTAEHDYLVKGKSVQDITATLPITEDELAPVLPIWKQKRRAYHAAMPSPLWYLREMLVQKVQEHYTLSQRLGKVTLSEQDLLRLSAELGKTLPAMDQQQFFVYALLEFLNGVYAPSDTERAIILRFVQAFTGDFKLQWIADRGVEAGMSLAARDAAPA